MQILPAPVSVDLRMNLGEIPAKCLDTVAGRAAELAAAYMRFVSSGDPDFHISRFAGVDSLTDSVCL